MQTTLNQAIWEMEAENRRLRENYQKLFEELGESQESQWSVRAAGFSCSIMFERVEDILKQIRDTALRE